MALRWKHIDMAKEEVQVETRVNRYRDEDLVFLNSRGCYANHDNMTNRIYRPLCVKAKVKGINFDSLRHFAISCWIEAGFSPKTVQTFACR